MDVCNVQADAGGIETVRKQDTAYMMDEEG